MGYRVLSWHCVPVPERIIDYQFRMDLTTSCPKVHRIASPELSKAPIESLLANELTNQRINAMLYRFFIENGVLHKSLPSVCVFVCVSPIVARQRLRKNVTAATNTHAKI
jgi:hypothetical protein